MKFVDPSAPGGAAYDRETRLSHKVQNNNKLLLYSTVLFLDCGTRKWPRETGNLLKKQTKQK